MKSTHTSIQHSIFVPPKPLLQKKDIGWEEINRICFRGDSRPPEEIFVTGFQPRKHTHPNDIIIPEPFASEYEVTVAVTKRCSVAAIFPFKKSSNPTSTWVYVCKVKQGFDIKTHGYLAFMAGSTGSVSQSEVLLKMFTEEVITPYILAKNIFGAIQLERSYDERTIDDRPEFMNKSYNEIGSRFEDDLIDFFQNQGHLCVKDTRENVNCTLSAVDKELAKQVVEREVQAIQKHPYLPVPTSGFYKDENKNGRSSNIRSSLMP